MSQNDMVIANQPGASFRADLNSALQALASLSSGASAPSTTYAYQLWADTSNNVLKQRDAGNSTWIILRSLDNEKTLGKSANYTTQVRDCGKTILADATAGAFTVTLPSAASAGKGWMITVKLISATNSVNIASTDNIDGGSPLSLASQNDAISIICTGSTFYVVSHYLLSSLVAGDGIDITSGIISVDLATNPGLEFSSAQLKILIDSGLSLSGAGLKASPDYDSGWLSQPDDATLRNVAHSLGGLPSQIMVLTKDSAGYMHVNFRDVYDGHGVLYGATSSTIYYRKQAGGEEFMRYYNSSNILQTPTSGDVKFLAWA